MKKLITLYVSHLYSEERSHLHRMSFGMITMALGVVISKCFHEVMIVHYFMDGFGYFLHALGGVPIIEYILKTVK